MSFVTLIGSVVKTTIKNQCLVQQSHVTHMSPIDVRVKISQLKWTCQLPRCPWEWMRPKQHRSSLSRQALKKPIRVFIPLLIHTAMAELSGPRGSKKNCTRTASSEDQTMPAWRRTCSKLLIQQHLSLTMITMKLMINIAMPLMFLFKQVLSMKVRVAEIEEMEVMKGLMWNVMKEKKKMEKGQGSKRGSSKESLERMELISERNTMTPSRKPRNSKRTISPMDANASSSHGAPQVIPNHVTKSCFCGLVPIQYTCRKEGQNVMISGAPNNWHLGTSSSTSNGWKTHYKAQKYEKMYDRFGFFGEVTQAQGHEVRAAIKQHIFEFRNRRAVYPTVSIKQPQTTGLQEVRWMQPQLERTGNHCPSAHAHLHQFRPSGDHQAQGPEHDPTLGRSKLLQGQEDEQEQGADSIHQPMSFKPGLRKRVLGEIEKAIDHLEKESQLNEQTINELSTQELQEVMRLRHLRLIGEVFMPRTIYQHGREIQPLSTTGLWSTATAATSLSQAKKIMFGSHTKATIRLGGSHPSMRNVSDVAVSRTRQVQRNLEKLCQARILLDFAALICHTQASLGGSFLFGQPWIARSWKEPCSIRLMNH